MKDVEESGERSVSFGLKASHGLLFSLSLMTPSMNTSFLFFLYSAVSFFIWRHLFNHKKQPKKEKIIPCQMRSYLIPVSVEHQAFDKGINQ